MAAGLSHDLEALNPTDKSTWSSEDIIASEADRISAIWSACIL
jgi:hypothetical protein